MRKGLRTQTFERLVPAVCLAAVFLLSIRLYSFAYFYVDDLNNFSLVQEKSGGQMLFYLLNPLENYYRPTGMLAYWIFFHLFGLQPLPYHLFAWTLHAGSSLLIFLILRHFVASWQAAALGGLLFVFQTTYVDVLYNFGTIFELLAGFFFFLGLWIFLRRGGSRRGLLLFSAVFYLAVMSKEMAITLPLVVLLHELLLGARPLSSWRLARQLWLPALIALALAGLKLSVMAESSPSAPYYLELSLPALSEGAVWYLNMLGRSSHTGWFWLAAAAAILLLLALLRDRRAWFFCLFVPLTFLPVIFLVNHRVPFYWYIPFLGAAGLAAVLVDRLVKAVAGRVRFRHAWVAVSLFFCLVSWWHYSFQERLSRSEREWISGLTREYRNFLSGLDRIPPVEAGQTIYFTSPPRYFDQNSIVSAARVTLKQPSLRAAIVETLPPEAVYHVDFDLQRLQFRRISLLAPGEAAPPAVTAR